jgi:hypothetical protein
MLKFHAKPGGLTAWPNSHMGGQARRYIGRVFNAETRGYAASTEPAEVQETDADAVHMARKCNRGELYPADEHTARYCGVKFVELEKGADGEWFPKTTKAKADKPSKD